MSAVDGLSFRETHHSASAALCWVSLRGYRDLDLLPADLG